MAAAFDWTGETASVTGAAGRMGSRVAAALRRRGAAVVAFDRQAVPAEAGLRTVSGELSGADALRRALEGCTRVFHLAALALPADSFARPGAYFRVNATGTFALLEACRDAGVRRVVFTSSCLVYGTPLRQPVPEDHPLDPCSPYAASKVAAETALVAYAGACGFSVDIARLGNLYGAQDPPETVVGRALGQARRGGPVRLRSLRPVRDFLHVDDAVEALVRLAEAGDEPGARVTNVGSGRGVSVGELAETLCRVVAEEGGPRLEVVEEGPERPGTDQLVLDVGRLTARTGWRPELALAEGLRRAWTEAAAPTRQGALRP